MFSLNTRVSRESHTLLYLPGSVLSTPSLDMLWKASFMALLMTFFMKNSCLPVLVLVGAKMSENTGMFRLATCSVLASVLTSLATAVPTAV